MSPARRSLLRLVLLGPLLGPPSAPLLAQPSDAATSQWTHAYAAFGQPKYPAGFSHFDYVNPDAPKGGTLKLSYSASFDSMNPFILKGERTAEGGGEGGGHGGMFAGSTGSMMCLRTFSRSSSVETVSWCCVLMTTR